MKKQLHPMIMLMLMAFLPLASAQETDEFGELDRMDRLNAQKVAFFTNRLQLTTAESEKFWPVYNEFQERRNELLEERRRLLANLNRAQSSLGDSEIAEMADRFIELQAEEAELARVYHEKFKQVLPVRKVIRLYQTENMYKTFLLRQLRERSQQIQQRRPLR